MSNVTQTVFENYRAVYDGKLDKFEQRGSMYSAKKVFQEESNGNDPESIISQDLINKAGVSFGVPLQIPVIDYENITIGNTRSCTIPLDEQSSKFIDVSFVTYVFGFGMIPQNHFNNHINYQASINKKLDARLKKLAETIDQAAVNTLENNINQYFPAEILSYYPQVGNALQVPQANKNDFYNQLASIYGTMDFDPSMVKVVSNFQHIPDVSRFKNQGSGNSSNEQFQYQPYMFNPTNRVVNGGPTIQSTGYSFPKGSVGLLSRLDPSSLSGDRVHESKFWDVFPNAPLVDMDLGVYYYADCEDPTVVNNAVGAGNLEGLTAAKVEKWQFSVDVAYLTSYNSDPANRFSPINKFEILA